MDRNFSEVVKTLRTKVVQHHESVHEIAETIRRRHGERCATCYLIAVAGNELFGQMLNIVMQFVPIPAVTGSMCDRFAQNMAVTVNELLAGEDEATRNALIGFIEQATHREVALMQSMIDDLTRSQRRDH